MVTQLSNLVGHWIGDPGDEVRSLLPLLILVISALHSHHSNQFPVSFWSQRFCQVIYDHQAWNQTEQTERRVHSGLAQWLCMLGSACLVA